MKDWWLQLSIRERTGVVSAALVVVLGVAYLALWVPVQEQTTLRQNRVKQLEADYRHMLQAQAELRRLPERQGTAPNPQALSRPGMGLLAQVDASLKRGGLAADLREIKPDGENFVRVSLNKAPFDQVIRWLQHLDSKGVDVVRMNINADDDPGQVVLSARLQGQGR